MTKVFASFFKKKRFLRAATTQGPISAVVLMMELTGYAREAIVPLLLAVAAATLVARTVEKEAVLF